MIIKTYKLRKRMHSKWLLAFLPISNTYANSKNARPLCLKIQSSTLYFPLVNFEPGLFPQGMPYNSLKWFNNGFLSAPENSYKNKGVSSLRVANLLASRRSQEQTGLILTEMNDLFEVPGDDSNLLPYQKGTLASKTLKLLCGRKPLLSSMLRATPSSEYIICLDK